MTADLVAWLRAQLDEDERVARAASMDGTEWRYEDRDEHPQRWTIFGAHWSLTTMWAYGLDARHRPHRIDPDSTARHIIRHDPARVLAEVAAKRAILELHSRPTFAPLPDYTSDADKDYHYCGEDSQRQPCDTLRLLAQPYAGRPGWREEWAT